MLAWKQNFQVFTKIPRIKNFLKLGVISLWVALFQIKTEKRGVTNLADQIGGAKVAIYEWKVLAWKQNFQVFTKIPRIKNFLKLGVISLWVALFQIKTEKRGVTNLADQIGGAKVAIYEWKVLAWKQNFQVFTKIPRIKNFLKLGVISLWVALFQIKTEKRGVTSLADQIGGAKVAFYE